MAYAAVASLSETIDTILNYHQDYTTPQFQNQILSLQKHSVFLQSFIEDAPDRANNWDETIREVTDRAEDIIELLLSESLLQSKSLYNSDELERVTEEMESVVKRVKGGRRSEARGGSDEELMKIISRLVEGSSELEIIPIVGMGGTGKTTLARNAYNHPLIVEHFEIRAWSVVSYEYSRRGIISELLRCMKAEGSMSDSEDEMMDRVYKRLYGKRYLIVMDDIWSWEAWDSLKLMFPDDRNGSRIILTTTQSNVAHYASLFSRTYIHEKRLLNEKESWNLVEEKVFKGDPCPSQLESTGKEIARRCKGHLLCIEVASGILAVADQTEAAWKDVLEIMEIDVLGGYDGLRRIISESYTYLPHHLRPCFLYLGIFPGDHEIHVSKLIKLWVAEGFLNESEYKSHEEIGEEWVEDLVRRSLVSVTKRKSNGRIKSITITHYTRGACLIQAGTDNFIQHVWRYDDGYIQDVEHGFRRVSTSICDHDIFEGVYGSTIRTIILHLKKKAQVRVISWSLGNVRLLRILDLSNANNYNLAKEVFGLFHLRYLAFHSGFNISEAISKLENLQTLIISSRENDGGMFGKLPKGVWRMPQIRHLIVFPFKLPSPRGATSALENLQTLSEVVDFVCSRENLKMIPNVNKLALLYTKKLKDYMLHNLIYLPNLEILKIEINWFFKKEMSCAFPPKLKKLNLCGVKLAWEDLKIVGSLPNLQVLKLRKNACIGKRWETSEGGFSQLIYLLIEESNLVRWITESTHFPRLKCLALRSCLHLLEIPNAIGKIPSLEIIDLDDRENQSLLMSANRFQEDRQSLGYDHLQIRLV